MYGQEPQYGQVSSRRDQTFNDVLYEQLRKTPWWLISIVFHALLAFIVNIFTEASNVGDLNAQVNSNMTDENLDPLKEEVKPEIEESKPIEEDEKVIEDPVIKDAKVSDHNETDNDLPFEESLGQKDFISDAPFEGPSTNAAIGIGGGAGGAFGGRGGHRNLKAMGGGAKTEGAVDLGLEWLKNHQDEEGMWDCDGFMKHDRVPPVCDGAGNALYDPGVSGLAILAFLGAGETHKHGRYKKTVGAGLRYMKQIQDPEGCFGPRTTTHFTYNHAIGALAMAEAYALTASPLFKQSAQNAIDFVLKCQNPYLAWRYGVRPQDNDTSVSGWMIMALKSAKAAGLRVDEAGFDGMKAWLEKVTEPEYGRAGYTARGTGPARPQDLMDKFPADKSESLTAVGILSRIFVGEDPRKSEMIAKGTELCLKALPVWDEASGAVDHYYWYYATLAIFQVGGEAWKTWNEAVKTAIIDHQRKDPVSFKGSWDAVDPWGREGGRVYSTAVLVMCMEVYYRYARVFGTK
jgi:hypothetical protein